MILGGVDSHQQYQRVSAFENMVLDDSPWLPFRPRAEEWAAARRAKNFDLVVFGDSAVELAIAHYATLAGFQVLLISPSDFVLGDPSWQLVSKIPPGRISHLHAFFASAPHLTFSQLRQGRFERIRPSLTWVERFSGRTPPLLVNTRRLAFEHLVAARNEGACSLHGVQVQRSVDLLGQGVELGLYDPQRQEQIVVRARYRLSVTQQVCPRIESYEINDPFGLRRVDAHVIDGSLESYGITIDAPRITVNDTIAVLAPAIARDVVRGLCSADSRPPVTLVMERELPGAFDAARREEEAVRAGVSPELIRCFGSTAIRFAGAHVNFAGELLPIQLLVYLTRVEQALSLEEIHHRLGSI